MDSLEQSDFDDLSAFFDGELAPARRAEIERLVREDPAWRQAYEELSAIDEALDGFGAAAPAPGLVEGILARIATGELPPSDLELLSAWLDGELAPAERARAERLVGETAAWRKVYEDFLAVDAALDSYDVPAPAPDLAEKVLARVAAMEVSAADMERLSAWADGELTGPPAAEVERLVAEHPAWRGARRDLEAVDQALDAWQAPAAPEGLADRVLAHVRRASRSRQVLRVVGWLGPAAAAAAVLLIVMTWSGGTRQVAPQPSPIAAERVELENSKAYQSVPKAERAAIDEMIIMHLELFKNYEVVQDFDTLQAIERLENERKGT